MPKSISKQPINLYFLLCVVFIATLLVMICLASDETPDRANLFTVTLFASFACFLVLFVWIKVKAICEIIFWWFTEDGQREDIVHLDSDTPIPDNLQHLADEIEDKGFTKFGVKQSTSKDNEQSRYWIWIDESKTVRAYLFKPSNKKPFVAFVTQYLDEFSIETSYRNSGLVPIPNFLIHNVNTSMAEAYAFHMHLYDEHAYKHGQIKIINTLQDTDYTPQERQQVLRQIYISNLRKLLPTTLLLIIATVGNVWVMILALSDVNKAFVYFMSGVVAWIFVHRFVSEPENSPNLRKSRKALK